MGVKFAEVEGFCDVIFRRLFGFGEGKVKHKIAVVIESESVLIFGLFFGGFEVRVALSMQTRFIVHVQLMLLTGIGLLLVHVVNHSFKTQFILKFLQVLQKTPFLNINQGRILSIVLVINRWLCISMPGH